MEEEEVELEIQENTTKPVTPAYSSTIFNLHSARGNIISARGFIIFEYNELSK